MKGSEAKEYIAQLKEEAQASTFPKWEDFPTVDLYMDQVIELVNRYISGYAAFKGAAAITPAMINNYVKAKTIPSPVKKRYSRIHLAYIIMVCVLKQTFSIAVIQKLVRADESEENVARIYNAFAQSQEEALKSTADEIEKTAEKDGELLMSVLSAANVYRSIAEQLVYENAKPKVVRKGE